jgi:hypothetical protein
MVKVSFCLLPVIATGHRLNTQEITVTIGVLRPSRIVSTSLAAWKSKVLSTMSILAAAATGEVCGLSQNNKCSFTSIRVYANGAKTKRIKIFSGAF